MPRKEKVEEYEMEEEELGHLSGATPSTERAPRPDLARDPHAPMALFAIGALLLLASFVLLGLSFAGEHYEVDVRQGPQPEGDTDGSNRILLRIGLREYTALFYQDNTGDPVREAHNWDDAPIVGIAMKQLGWTAYVGTGLLALAFLAGLLHRFGALTVAGPAPILALFGVVVLTVGLSVFVLDIAHHARVQWIGGRLDLAPAFWTANADGDFWHDLYMRPLAGFWFHAVGAGAGLVGSILMFWGQLTGVGRDLKRFAESAHVA